MTEYAKRGLPDTSNSINLKDHNLFIKRHMKLTNYSPMLCFLLTKVQDSSIN